MNNLRAITCAKEPKSYPTIMANYYNPNCRNLFYAFAIEAKMYTEAQFQIIWAGSHNGALRFPMASIKYFTGEDYLHVFKAGPQGFLCLKQGQKGGIISHVNNYYLPLTEIQNRICLAYKFLMF